jgi:hypothetical protein
MRVGKESADDLHAPVNAAPPRVRGQDCGGVRNPPHGNDKSVRQPERLVARPQRRRNLGNVPVDWVDGIDNRVNKRLGASNCIATEATGTYKHFGECARWQMNLAPARSS